MFKVKNLTKTFTSGFWPFTAQQSFTAVNNISFEIKPGEILGFLGPNGAGKTTTIQMLLGTLTPTSGTISYFGDNFAHNRVAGLKNIGYSSGYERLPAQLSILENLDIVGRIYGLNAQERTEQIEKLLRIFGMWEKRNERSGSLSAGQSTRVMLAKAFIANPKLVLLDEPSASLDPDIAREVRAFILTQRKEHNTAILITSHNMDEVTELCDRVLVLKGGSIIANSTPEQLMQSIAQITVHLSITHGFDLIITHLQKSPYLFTTKSNIVSVTLDEHQIAQFLTTLSAQSINYSHISINKPTLEDYFMSIAK